MYYHLCPQCMASVRTQPQEHDVCCWRSLSLCVILIKPTDKWTLKQRNTHTALSVTHECTLVTSELFRYLMCKYQMSCCISLYTFCILSLTLRMNCVIVWFGCYWGTRIYLVASPPCELLGYNTLNKSCVENLDTPSYLLFIYLLHAVHLE